MPQQPVGWNPWSAVATDFPEVKIVTRELPERVQGCVDPGRGIIWLAEGLSPVEQRCVLAYELAQLHRGPLPEDPCMAAAHRRDCEEWAARMLVPVESLCGAFSMFGYLETIAEWLDVDLPTLRQRLRSLTDAEQDALMEAIRRSQSAVA